MRKTIKRVGEELLDDPEIGSEFMQPLKMQGVVDVLQTDLVVRCKFTATPLRPTYLQRQALRRLIDAFAASRAKLFDKLCSCCVVLQGVHKPLEFVDRDRRGLGRGRRLGCLRACR